MKKGLIERLPNGKCRIIIRNWQVIITPREGSAKHFSVVYIYGGSFHRLSRDSQLHQIYGAPTIVELADITKGES